MISVVSSVYNEGAILPELLGRLVVALSSRNEGYEIILIDNGSMDETPAILTDAHAKNPNVKMIQLSRNFGQVMALRAGLEFAKGDVVVIMDGDLQDLPEEIPKLLSKLGEGYDLVYAKRLNRQDSIFRKLSSLGIRKLLSFLMKGGDMPPGDERMLVGVFRAMKREVADAIKNLPEHTEHIQGLIRWVGFRQTLVEVEHGKRHAGKSKYPFKKLLAYALDGAVAASTYPLRLVTFVGIVLASAAFFLGIWQFVYRILYGTQLAGFTTLILVILFIGGMQFIILGILGEYIGRIYTETKHRPLFVVKKKLL